MLKAVSIAILLLAGGQAAIALIAADDALPPVGSHDQIESGRHLAERHCFGCHAVHETGALASFPPAPPFVDLPWSAHDRESLTVVVLTRGHPDSLRTVLAPERLDELRAYLGSLREGASGGF